MTKDRERFSAEELAICLSHYDIGPVRNVHEFPRGSRRAPKVLIESQRGKFLLKRRAKGKDDLSKVAFAHQLQLSLAGRNFPLPHLITTREQGESMLVLENNIYELFEFVEGGVYDASLDATYHAGRILGLFHKLLKDFRSDYHPPSGSYHNADAIHNAIRNTVSSLPLETRPSRDVLAGTVESLEKTYRACAKEVESLGLYRWDSQIVHGDWHPGNMLFAKGRVVAVIDYDAARIQQHVIDFANGALQFSIIAGSDDPGGWPERLDETRFKRFMRGYDSAVVISVAELEAVPYLMCEAMIAEAVLPIAATGSFGRLEGFSFLQMVDRKVRWIVHHVDELCGMLKD